MASSLPPVSPNIFAIKLKLHCSRCENKLKRLLLKVQGVQAIIIDSKQGTIIVSGNMDPPTIVALLGTVGRKAEVLWEQRKVPSISKDNDDHQNLQIVAQSKVVDHQFNDPDAIAKMLLGIFKRLDVEVSKTITLTLKDPQTANKTVEITIRDGVHSPQISHSGGFCTASASCYGEHGALNRNLHGSCGCCKIHAVGHPHWATHGCGCVPPGPPPPWPAYSPSAPPLGMVYDMPSTSTGRAPPPLMGYSSSSYMGDDSPAGSCSIV